MRFSVDVRIIAAAFAGLALLSPSPVTAQTADAAALPDAPPPNARRLPSRDFVAIGVGAISNFPGAADFRVIPFVAGRWDPGYVDARLRGTALQISVLPTKPRGTFIESGPAARLRFGRTRGLDPQVEQVGRVGNAFELGGFVGLYSRGIDHPGDELRVTVQALADVSSVHRGATGLAEVGYARPIAKRTLVDVSGFAEWLSRKTTSTYFGVDQVQAARSGLPVFDAGAGASELGLRLSITRAFSRRWGVTVTGSGSRLIGDAADSPIVRRLGSRTQGQFGLAVSYRF